MPFAQECVWAFQTRATLSAIFEKFPFVPPFHFVWKCGFWVTLQMDDFKILAFQNPEFKIFDDFKILTFQNPEFKILDDFKILAFQNPQLKILADFNI